MKRVPKCATISKIACCVYSNFLEQTIDSNLCRLCRIFLIGVVFVPMNHVDRMLSYGHWVALLGNCQILGIFKYKDLFRSFQSGLELSLYNNSIYLSPYFLILPLWWKETPADPSKVGSRKIPLVNVNEISEANNWSEWKLFHDSSHFNPPNAHKDCAIARTSEQL